MLVKRSFPIRKPVIEQLHTKRSKMESSTRSLPGGTFHFGTATTLTPTGAGWLALHSVDGDSFEFRPLLRWCSLRSLLVAVGALLAAPVITQLGALLGWW